MSRLIPTVLLSATLLVAAAPARAQVDRLAYLTGEAKQAESVRDHVRAVVFYTQILKELEPPDEVRREILTRRATAYEFVRDHDRAEQDWAAALEIVPVDPAVHAARGFFFLRRQRHGDALADFVVGAGLDPANPVFLYGQGRVLAGRGDYRGAIDRYSEAIRIAPQLGSNFLWRAEARVRLGDHARAQADYDRALELGGLKGPEVAFAYVGRGMSRFTLENMDGAIDDFSRALDRFPGDPRTLKWRGYAYERLGRYELALADYERASRQTSYDPWLKSSLRRIRSR
ncbi:MAG: tetratricopeptide repeat protein [Xanthobacteraceae bacterium]|nr:tetratricopeptide repeat protein [Xanthobacteraceae bacterium]